MKKTSFTLIEVMVAIFVLIVGIVAVLNIFPLGLQVRKGAEMSAIASWLGQEKIEEIISLSYAYADISSGTIESRHFLDSPYNNYERETVVSCLQGTDLSEVSCDVLPAPLKKIKVTVFWKPPFKLTTDETEIITLIVEK